MMAAILNSAIVDSATVILNSDTLLSSLRFTQKHSHSSLTQTNWIWLKLIHSDLTWWCQPSWNLPSWIQPFCTKLWLKNSTDSNSFILTQLYNVSHLEYCHLGFINFAQNSSNSFILTQLDDGSHALFHVGIWHCHLGFRHLVIFSQDSLKNTRMPLWLWLKLIQSESNSFILTQLDDVSHLEFSHFAQNSDHLGFSSL